jgi:flavin reductase (DIM6/NTAB) family NADH-FMN oxidoreductase RutF
MRTERQIGCLTAARSYYTWMRLRHANLPFPVWVVRTYYDEGKPNMTTAAWGGICCSRPPYVYFSLREASYSHGNIVKRKAYTPSFGINAWYAFLSSTRSM